LLQYEADLVRDGRTLPRPVNYLLTRIVPAEEREEISEYERNSQNGSNTHVDNSKNLAKSSCR
jgi:hypothetical protein